MVCSASSITPRRCAALSTRPDVDKSALAYLGVSQCSAEGVIYTALEDLFKTAALLDGGLFMCNCVGGLDQVNFAPPETPCAHGQCAIRLVFSFKETQEPLLRMLETPSADKRLVDFETYLGQSISLNAPAGVLRE